MLCERCLFVIETTESLDIKHPHHKDLPSLEASVAAKCLICQSIWEELTPAEWETAQTIKSGSSLTVYEVHDQPSAQNTPVKLLGIFGLDLDPVKILRRYDFYESNLTKGTTWALGDSTRNLDFVRTWMSQCDANHSSCNNLRLQSAPRACPERLLRVGRPGDLVTLLTTSNIIRDGAGDSSGPRYATVSYCWGDPSAMRLKLLESNLNQLQKSIRLEHLPRTIADAVDVARDLEIPFLWVDALCIIQDSKEDWQHQADQMAEIYRGSCLNIAATYTRSCDDGLYVRRDPSRLQPCIVFAKHQDHWGNFQLVERTLWWDNIERAPLNLRGWVLQERYLAARTVHFSYNQLFWECASQDSCEECPGEVFRSDWRSSPKNHRDLGRGHWDGWKRIIEAYSRCQLTYDSDKLVAISGIAKVLAQEWRVDYLAGLFDDVRSIGSQLAWRPRQPTTRAVSYRAPSWSWASINGPVEFPSLEVLGFGHSLVKTIGAHISPRGIGPYGEVTSGWLRLHLQQKDLPLASFRVLERPNISPLFFNEGLYCQDHSGCARLIVSHGVMAGHRPDELAYQLDLEASHCDGSTEVLMLPLLESTTNALIINGLLVQLSEENLGPADGTPVYRRLGFFRYHTRRALATEKSIFESSEGTKRHNCDTICLV